MICAQRRAWEQKSIVELKPVPIVKHVKIWQFFLTKVVQEHAVGVAGSTDIRLLEIY